MTRVQGDLLTLGVEDGSFPASLKRQRGFKTLLVAVLLKELKLWNLRIGVITVDGNDATDSTLKIIKDLELKPNLLLLGGISYGGFNFIDPFRLKEETNLPSIIVTTRKPDNTQVRKALQDHFPDWKARWNVYKRLNNFQAVRPNPRANPIFIETVGITSKQADACLKRLTKIGRRPEPLRAARIAAHGLSIETYLEVLNLELPGLLEVEIRGSPDEQRSPSSDDKV